MLPTLHVDINHVRQVNFLHLCCGSSIACSKNHLFSLWERDCSALSARQRYHSVSTVNTR